MAQAPVHLGILFQIASWLIYRDTDWTITGVFQAFLVVCVKLCAPKGMGGFTAEYPKKA